MYALLGSEVSFGEILLCPVMGDHALRRILNALLRRNEDLMLVKRLIPQYKAEVTRFCSAPRGRQHLNSVEL